VQVEQDQKLLMLRSYFSEHFLSIPQRSSR